MNKSIITLAIVMATSAAHADLSELSQTYSTLVGESGEIAFPTHFQTELVHLGTTAVYAENKAKLQNLNGIYTQKSAIEAYQQTGAWPDGTVFVKDVKFVEHERLSTGVVGHQQGNDIFFVMVKDNVGRFSDNPNWGDGWGWAMFDAVPVANASPNRQFCLACHSPRKDDNYLFTDQYPVLTLKPE